MPPSWVRKPAAQVDGGDYERAAIWMGTFDGPELVGCLCQCGRVGGRFELETTLRLPCFLSKDAHSVEISRVAVRPGSDEWGVLTALLQFSIAYGRSQGHSYHFTTGAYHAAMKRFGNARPVILIFESIRSTESSVSLVL